jgi:DNA-binding beta-propeller fold protein YncE
VRRGLALALLALAAPAASASTITETQCFQAPGVERGCTPTVGLEGAAAVAVSPDARNVYVGGNVEEHGTLLTYTRDLATGALTPAGCFADNARDGCTPNEALFGVNDVAISRDGLTVYALGILPGSVGVFRRDPATGALTPVQCVQEGYADLVGCPRVHFENPWKFALTADGKGLLVLGSHFTLFTVGAGGLLSDPIDERLHGVRNPAAITAGRDPGTVYVAGGTEDRGRISVLDRDPATGQLAVRACSGDANAGQDCRRARAVDGPADLALSPDGRGLYLAASSFTPRNPDDPFGFDGVMQSSAVSVFAPRRAAQKACLIFAGRERDRDGCHHAPRERGAGFFGASTVAVAPNGKAIVAGFDKSSAVAVLRRNPQTQGLSAAPGGTGCVKDAERTAHVPRGCAGGHGIYQPNDIAISPDARSAYVTTPGGLAVFALALD